VLLLTSLAPVLLGWAGPFYLISAAALGGLFMSATLRRLENGDLSAWGRRVFLVSLSYLPLLFTALLLDGRA
jgi:heme O synthase-like polyprenyltransferase